LIDIIKENKLTALFVTHSQEEAFEIGDRIAVLNKGQLEQTGTPAELIDNPKTIFVATFIGENLVFKAKLLKQLTSNSFMLNLENLGEITITTKNELINPSENLVFVYRINNLEVSKEITPDSFEANVISKKIIGNNVRYYLETPSKLRFFISISGSNSDDFTDSSKVYVRFLPNKGYLFNA